MKKVLITMELTVTDKFFKSELKHLKNDILSGKYQRELKSESDGVKKVKATYKEIN